MCDFWTDLFSDINYLPSVAYLILSSIYFCVTLQKMSKLSFKALF